MVHHLDAFLCSVRLLLTDYLAGGPGPGGFKPAEVEAWLKLNTK